MSSLNIATRALNANLSALQVIGHNIANVNTEGYSRQTVQLQSSGYQAMGSGYFGKGVEIATVERTHSAYLTSEARATSSTAAADSVRLARLQQLESAFPMGENGLGTALNSMLNAWNDVTSAPSNLTARVVTIARADEFASRLRNTAGQLDLLKQGTELQVQTTVDSINRLAKDLASVNQSIIENAGGAHTPNDLLDSRDQLLAEMSKLVKIATVPGESGTVNVFVGGSQPLVLGAQPARLAVTRDPVDTSRIQVSFQQGNTQSDLNLAALGGGELAGMVRFLNEDLAAAQNQIGRMALATATIVNDQHALGVDLTGQPGQAFFAPTPPIAAIAAPANTGTAAFSVTVTDATALKASDYDIRAEAGGLRIVRLSDNTMTPPAGNPPLATGALPIEVDGLTFTLDSGTVGATDRFRARPFEAAARNIQVAIGAPDKLAAASPVAVTPGTTNSGSLAVESLYATAADANLTSPVSITFGANGTYTLSGASIANPATVYNYAPGEPIQVNGWSLTLRGAPTAGDTFAVQASPANGLAQNAGNASAVLGLRDLATFDGVSLSDGYVSLFSDIGTRVQGAQFAAEFSGNVAATAEAARAGVAGVNLDEEAARLLQFQQAYQASAKFLQIAQSTFDSLLQTVGR